MSDEMDIPRSGGNASAQVQPTTVIPTTERGMAVQEEDGVDWNLVMEVTAVYHELYAAGLASLFETSWFYFTEGSRLAFPRNEELVRQIGEFLSSAEASDGSSKLEVDPSAAEALIVWQLASTIRSVAAERVQTQDLIPMDGDPAEARARFDVVDALVHCTWLPFNPLTSGVNLANPGWHNISTQRVKEFDFWFALGELVRQRDLKAAEVDSLLKAMRRSLGGRENRDVLYSIAVVRMLAPDFISIITGVPVFKESKRKHRLYVAWRYLVHQGGDGGASTNVLRRVCDRATQVLILRHPYLRNQKANHASSSSNPNNHE